MIKWREPLYLDEKMMDGQKVADVMELMVEKKTSLREMLMPVYGVFLAQNPANLLEIISIKEFLQPGYGSREFICVGLAGSRESAEELVRVILEDTLHHTGGLKVREYLCE